LPYNSFIAKALLKEITMNVHDITFNSYSLLARA